MERRKRINLRITMKKKLIFIDNDAEHESEFLRFLKQEGFEITKVFKYGPHAQDYIQNMGEYDIAIIDRCLSGPLSDFSVTGEDLMRLSKEINPKAIVISFSGYDDKLAIVDKHLCKPAFYEDLEDLVNYLRERTK